MVVSLRARSESIQNEVFETALTKGGNGSTKRSSWNGCSRNSNARLVEGRARRSVGSSRGSICRAPRLRTGLTQRFGLWMTPIKPVCSLAPVTGNPENEARWAAGFLKERRVFMTTRFALPGRSTSPRRTVSFPAPRSMPPSVD